MPPFISSLQIFRSPPPPKLLPLHRLMHPAYTLYTLSIAHLSNAIYTSSLSAWPETSRKALENILSVGTEIVPGGATWRGCVGYLAGQGGFAAFGVIRDLVVDPEFCPLPRDKIEESKLRATAELPKAFPKPTLTREQEVRIELLERIKVVPFSADDLAEPEHLARLPHWGRWEKVIRRIVDQGIARVIKGKVGQGTVASSKPTEVDGKAGSGWRRSVRPILKNGGAREEGTVEGRGKTVTFGEEDGRTEGTQTIQSQPTEDGGSASRPPTDLPLTSRISYVPHEYEPGYSAMEASSRAENSLGRTLGNIPVTAIPTSPGSPSSILSQQELRDWQTWHGMMAANGSGTVIEDSPSSSIVGVVGGQGKGKEVDRSARGD